MKTSLLVLSLLMASTNAIEITAAPAAVPKEAATAPVVDPTEAPTAPAAAVDPVAPAAAVDPVAKVVAKPAAAPHIVDHKVDSPAHHVVAKGHTDITKDAVVKAPAAKDNDAADVKTDHKAAVVKDDVKCETNSCKAARAIKKLDAEKESKDVAKPADADAKTAPKMVVVHKADDKKAETPKVHTIITRPAAKHADPSTKAH